MCEHVAISIFSQTCAEKWLRLTSALEEARDLLVSDDVNVCKGSSSRLTCVIMDVLSIYTPFDGLSAKIPVNFGLISRPKLRIRSQDGRSTVGFKINMAVLVSSCPIIDNEVLGTCQPGISRFHWC